MGPHGETLLDALPTPATVLRGMGRWDSDDGTASVCCFAFEQQHGILCQRGTCLPRLASRGCTRGATSAKTEATQGAGAGYAVRLTVRTDSPDTGTQATIRSRPKGA
jgi:hypothetical protein